MLPSQGTEAGGGASPAGGARQLGNMPRDELNALAEEFGVDPSSYRTPQHLVAAIHARRQLIASLDREALLDVVRWGRRPVPLNANKEQLAQEVARIKSMKFEGLSRQGLMALAQLRGLSVSEGDDMGRLVRKLKRQEGFFAKLNRKRRSLMGSLVSNMLGGEGAAENEYQYLPPQQPPAEAPRSEAAGPRPASIKEEIEESGLLGGIAGRIRRSADAYVNQKLDEIEARIDRKLDEIDRRLAEWRDKEIANRLRILKITLWVTVIVAAASLLYSYIRVYLVPLLK
jgi:hypothetical protein